MVIRAYHRDRGERQRDVVLIPASAHGTNPASAAMAGMRVVVVASDDARQRRRRRPAREGRGARKTGSRALMITYPSHARRVRGQHSGRSARIVHRARRPGLHGRREHERAGGPDESRRPIGADVCHLNLHKTFAFRTAAAARNGADRRRRRTWPRICPGHRLVTTGGDRAIHAVSAAPWGSASILLISYGYIRMLGADGADRRHAIRDSERELPQVAARAALSGAVRARERPRRARADLRPAAVQRATGIDETDVAKRLMDYGFHAPTVSFPVAGTLMVEPTESETEGGARPVLRRDDRDSPGDSGRCRGKRRPRPTIALKNAPHTATAVAADAWPHPYSREAAAFPLAVRPREQVLAAVSRASTTSVWRSQPDVLRAPLNRGVRARMSKVGRENSEGQPPQPF